MINFSVNYRFYEIVFHDWFSSAGMSFSSELDNAIPPDANMLASKHFIKY